MTITVSTTGTTSKDDPEHIRVHFADRVDQVARLALAGIQQEYPNHISHTLVGDCDAKPPRELTPAFYGCFDWHSAVHGHWMLVRLCRFYPEADFYPNAMQALGRSLTKANIEAEVAYASIPARRGFERPYGMAWLLQLCTELREWSSMQPAGPISGWLSNLTPLEHHAAGVFLQWLPLLQYPLRVGTHAQTAFSLSLVLDWSRYCQHSALEQLILTRSQDFYGDDLNAPVAYEPSGHDFLSPALAEADLMRRVLPQEKFLPWLDAFLPMIPRYITDLWLHPVEVSDESDGHLVHLHGLNLSRAWMLEGILSCLPDADPRRLVLRRTASVHAEAGLSSVLKPLDEIDYAGGHWLGSFATYLATQRGLADE